ncbi:MAG: hypothetical protein A3K19_21250 [Lentisphaerae bacterium RIFOXYB12_FULL_65_16]|nr:MAG: hypothetical protein A3K18_33925 [Lentisphaerae bacterium RIFOXYA12_64_32]OGV93659.1 MAG: hypothetical protein A3K19_21250 [Lentisphaerae bacterium RIFOXYB12_FULL_65_16]
MQFDLAFSCDLFDGQGQQVYAARLDTDLILARQGIMHIRLPLVGRELQQPEPCALYLVLTSNVNFEETTQQDAPGRAEPTRVVSRTAKTRQGLQDWILPKVDFADTPLPQVLDWIRKRGRELDPTGKGIEIWTFLPPGPDKAGREPLSMNVEDIPLGELIRYVCMASRTGLRVQSAAVVIYDKEVLPDGADAMQTRYDFQNEERSTPEFLPGDPHDSSSPANVRVLADYGVDTPPGAWFRFLEFPVGRLFVHHNTPQELRDAGKVFSMLDGGLWFMSHIRERLRLVEVRDARLLAAVREHVAHPERPVDWRGPVTQAGTEGMILLQDLQTLVVPGTEGRIESMCLSPENKPVRFTIKSRTMEGGVDVSLREPYSLAVEWQAEGPGLAVGVRGRSVFGTWRQQHLILPTPYLARSPEAAERTFVVLTASEVNPYWVELPQSYLVDDPWCVSQRASDPVPEVRREGAPAAADESTPPGRQTRYYGVTLPAETVAAVVGCLAESLGDVSLDYYPGTGKLYAEGPGAQLEEAGSALRLLEPSPREYRVSVAPNGSPQLASVGFTLPGNATVLPVLISAPPAQSATTELTIRVSELVCGEAYQVEVSTAAAGDTAAQTRTVRVAPGCPAQLDVAGGLTLTVDAFDTCLHRIGKPFEDVVGRHARRRRERQARFAESAKILNHRLVPEFVCRQADLVTAVTALRAICKARQMPAPGARLEMMMPDWGTRLPEKVAAARVPAMEFPKDGEDQATDDDAAPDPAIEKWPLAWNPKLDIDLHGQSLWAVLQHLQSAYLCRVDVRDDEIWIFPGPDVAIRRYSVSKDRLKDAREDVRGYLQRQGVAMREYERVLYFPEYDTVLAAGSDAFLDQVGKALGPASDR